MATTTVNKFRWNARNLHKRLKADLPAGRSRLQASVRNIRLAAQDGNQSLSPLDFDHCARVYAWEGIVGLMEGEESTLEYLYQATYYKVAAHRYMAALYLAPPKTSMAQTSFNDIALALACTVALGCWHEAGELAKILCAGLTEIRIFRDDRDPTYESKHSYFYGTNNSWVAPFILQLYSQARGIRFPLDHLDANPFASMQTYEPLLHLWQTTNMDAFQPALLTACDTHLYRSKPPTKGTTPEFATLTDMLYPAEILMLLRLREVAGLTTPTFDHPLLNTAVGRLYPVRDIPHDPDLDKALANCLQWIAVTRPTLPTP